MFKIPVIVLLMMWHASSYGDNPETLLTFGVYTSSNAATMYKQFTPIITYLQKDMNQNLGYSLKIKFHIFKSYSEANDALVKGALDFVRFGPASYIIAKSRNSGLQLLAMESKNGKKRFKGMIVVPAHSPIRSLQDLKGRRFAFGNPNSTIGRYLAQAKLVEAGIFAKDLESYKYLNRHDKVFKAVELGDYDAGALKESTFKRYNQNKLLRVLLSFDNVTKPWIARAGLDDKLVNALRYSLLNLKDQKILNKIKVTGFLPSTDKDYQQVRDDMAVAGAFFKTQNVKQ